MTAAAPVVDRPILTFEEEPHVYRVNGRIVPSVTTILKLVWPEIWPWKSEFAMERGSLVHKAAHLYTQGDLDAKRLSPYIAGFLSGAIRFLAEEPIELIASEHRMYSSIYDYAGTSDWICFYRRKLAIIDLKTGDPGWQCGPQTFAYAQAYQEETGDVVRERYGLWLKEDGSTQLIPYKNNRDDQADFLAARRVLARREMLTAGRPQRTEP